MAAELFHVDGPRHMTKLIVPFGDFANEPTNRPYANETS